LGSAQTHKGLTLITPGATGETLVCAHHHHLAQGNAFSPKWLWMADVVFSSMLSSWKISKFPTPQEKTHVLVDAPKGSLYSHSLFDGVTANPRENGVVIAHH